MKALFAGLGSIGSRHLRNLWAECEARGLPLEVTALRSSGRPLPGETAALVTEEIQAVPPPSKGERWDIGFITGPTHLHAAALGALKDQVNCWFIEKPIFETTGYNLDLLGLGPAQKAYVAAPMRWCGVYAALKERLGGLPVYSVRALCSSYLPGWRPNADYRTVYSAHADMGGGVALDLIHEWDYLTDLFGFPADTALLRGRFSNLEIDSDDLAVYIARYGGAGRHAGSNGFLCELHLDYFGRAYRREVEVFSEAGSLVADFGAGMLRLPDGTVEDHAEPANRRYEREMTYFLNYALGGETESVNCPRHALAVLGLALGKE